MIDYHEKVNEQKDYFHSGVTKDLGFRLDALEKLRESIQENEQSIIEALQADLNKSEFEAYSTEIGVVLTEIRFILKHLRTWMKPKRVKTPITHFGSRSYIYPEPYGVTLIISPWNFPFQLTMLPLIGAIAAGNCATIKPSEFTPETSGLLQRLISDIFPESYISVIQGEVETSTALLAEEFDYIFFTGNPHVGKIVMKAAAKHLTPITLELGGKSPCIVHEDANVKVAAKRIAWGKFMNAGQTCVAPDYLYVHHKIKDKFLDYFMKEANSLYGKQALENRDYTRIVSKRHFNRLIELLDHGQTILGGEFDETKLTIEPTVLTDVTWEDPIMQEEIFGPILPVLEYDQLSEVLDGIQHYPNPLALYLFTESRRVEEEVLHTVPFGGGCINDTIYHIVSPYLPFGGVGTSGKGAYHGKASFDTFSHQKSVLKQTTLFDIPFRYPNVKNGLRKIKMFLK